MNKTLLLIVLLVPSIAIAQSPVKILSKSVPFADYYEWLTSLSVGPYKAVEMTADEYENAGADVVVGRKYRVAVATSEIYSSVYIEKITHGTEGCCVKLKSIQKLDLYDLKKKYNFIGESMGFKVLGWDNFNTFNFTIHSKKFKATIKGMNDVEVAMIEN